MIIEKVSSVGVLLSVLWLLQMESVVTTKIECIQLQLCPMAMNLIKTKPYAPETIEFFRYSHCGFDGNHPKIWCTLFLYCKTPDSHDGICVNVKECDSYMEYLANVDRFDQFVKKYLREFRCSTDLDPEIKVCCPEVGKFHGIISTNDVHERFLNLLPDPDLGECGQQIGDNRIVGGVETYLDEFPWLALLKYVNKNQIQYACGGSLVNEQYVLTAAHCVDPYIINRKNLGKLYSVILGEYDTRNATDCVYQKYGEDCADPPQEFKLDSYIMHPNYDSTKMINDIAIIRLNRRARLSDYVKLICLPPLNFRLRGNETFVISGWGRTETEKRSPIKRKARLTYVDRRKCNKYNGRKSLSDRQICVGIGNGVDSCYGDSGGPLMFETRTRSGLATFIMGIVSYGYGQLCGSFPGVYTYIPPYIEWINKQIR